MKKTVQFLLALAIISLSAISAYAQPPGAGDRMGRMDPEQRAERQASMMKDSLQLTDDLTAEVKAVLLVYTKKMQEARQSSQGDWSAMRGTMQTLREEQDEELQALLTAEQWTKWETIRAAMMQTADLACREKGKEEKVRIKKKLRKPNRRPYGEGVRR